MNVYNNELKHQNLVKRLNNKRDIDVCQRASIGFWLAVGIVCLLVMVK